MNGWRHVVSAVLMVVSAGLLVVGAVASLRSQGMAWGPAVVLTLILFGLALVVLRTGGPPAWSRPDPQGGPLWLVEFRRVGGRYEATARFSTRWRPGGFLFGTMSWSEGEWRVFRDGCERSGLAEFTELPLDDPIPLSYWKPVSRYVGGDWQRDTPWGWPCRVSEHEPNRWWLRCADPLGKEIEGPMAPPWVAGSDRPWSRTEALTAADRWIEQHTPVPDKEATP